MEAVKERPPNQSIPKKVKQANHSPSENSNAKLTLTPPEEILNSEIQVKQEKTDSQANNSVQHSSQQDVSTTGTAATTAGVGSLKPKEFIPTVNFSYDKSRINHFLIYPICINISTANWEKMCNFYEEVLELPMVRHPDFETIGFLGNNVGIVITKNLQNSKIPQNRIELVLQTDLPLTRLTRKLQTRGIVVEQKSLPNASTPFLQVLDPDGNIISFSSLVPENSQNSYE